MSDSLTSSRVDLKDSTRVCGNFLINQQYRKSGKVNFHNNFFVLFVSSVANNLFSAKTSDLLNTFISVDFPTLLYPTRALSPFFLCSDAGFSSAYQSSQDLLSIWQFFSRTTLRSVSISVSPGPLSPMPPAAVPGGATYLPAWEEDIDTEPTQPGFLHGQFVLSWQICQE